MYNLEPLKRVQTSTKLSIHLFDTNTKYIHLVQTI